ncbi:MAG: TetR family transcriptional regulator [Acidobacteriaceae bacterium]|nr:TetR family transcriptional regulator [Acidobacteriaceae bacterium]
MTELKRLAMVARRLLVATWEVAFVEAHRVFLHSRNIKKANAAFLAVVDQGSQGLKAAVEGSPYA